MKENNNKLKELEKRIKILEEIKLKKNEGIWLEVLLSYISMPIWLPIHLTWLIILLFFKPFFLYSDKVRKNKLYYLEGKFNFCEYIWCIYSYGNKNNEKNNNS